LAKARERKQEATPSLLFPLCPTPGPSGYTAPMSSDKSPAVRPQHNGWTQERQQQFLDHLAQMGSVSAAARAAGMTRQSAYWLRRQPAGVDFARAWDASLADAGQQIEDLAMDRLFEGEEEVIERDGVVVEVRRRPCDVRLIMFQLKRQDDRRRAAEALQMAVLMRRLEHRDAAAGRGLPVSAPPDPSKVSKVREELQRMAGEHGML